MPAEVASKVTPQYQCCHGGGDAIYRCIFLILSYPYLSYPILIYPILILLLSEIKEGGREEKMLFLN